LTEKGTLLTVASVTADGLSVATVEPLTFNHYGGAPAAAPQRRPTPRPSTSSSCPP
jgi:hypothetical protein